MHKITIDTSTNKNNHIKEMWVHDQELNLGHQVGNHECFNVDFLTNNLKTDSVFLDIGGYEGYFSLIAANIIKTGKIITFEPTPTSHAIIKKNIELYNIKNIELMHGAISNRSGKTEVMWRQAAECVGRIFDNPADHNRMERQMVDTYCLDDLFGHVDVIKMDIEGAEVEAFEGSKNFFKRNPQCLVMLELHCIYIRPRTDKSLDQFMDYLWNNFYISTNIAGGLTAPLTKEQYDSIRSTGGANIVLISKMGE